MLGSKLRMRPPLCKMRLGELYGSSDQWTEQKEVNGEIVSVNRFKGRELGGLLMSLSYEFPDNGPWEIAKGKRVPKHINADITYRVLHDEVPGHDTSFYGYAGVDISSNNATRGAGKYYDDDGNRVAEPEIRGW